MPLIAPAGAPRTTVVTTKRRPSRGKIRGTLRERGQAVPDSECEARGPEQRGDGFEPPGDGVDRERAAPRGRDERHRQGGGAGEENEREARHGVVRHRTDEQD